MRSIDPFWSTQTIIGIHANMIYDTLFSSDIDLKPQPQMVDTWSVSDDRKTYTFTLRDGLRFHDGSPVTTRDVIASLQRWGKHDGAGKTLLGYTASMTAKDDKTFVWALSEPYGLLIDTIAKSATSLAVIMREKEAMTGEIYKGRKDPRKAEQLFKEAGYNGEPITILHATDHQYITPAGLILAQQLRQGGFLKPDIQSMDWVSVVARRTKKESPAQGGWNLFITGTSVLNSSNPMTHTSLAMSCDKTFEDMRTSWAFAPGVAKRKQIAAELSKRAYEQVPYISFAQWRNPVAYRADRLSGVITMPSLPPMWNIEKK